MSNRKLTILIRDLRVGGAEKVTVNFANYYTSKYREHRLEILFFGDRKDLLANISHRVSVSQIRLGHVPVFRFWSLMVEIARRVKSGDVWCVHGFPLGTAFLIARLRRGRSFRLISVHHNRPDRVFGSQLRHVWKMLLFFDHFIADSVVSVSKGLRDWMVLAIDQFADKNVVCYNRIHLPSTLSRGGQSVVRNFLLGVGSLTFQKNHSLLIDAFYLIKDKYDIDLIILGEGELRTELLGQIELLNLGDRVSLKGNCDPWEYYVQCAAFCLPSRYEALPTVLVEALYAGAKIVSVDCEFGPAEILGARSGVCVGTLSKGFSPEEFADAIELELATKRDRSLSQQVALQVGETDHLEILLSHSLRGVP